MHKKAGLADWWLKSLFYGETRGVCVCGGYSIGEMYSISCMAVVVGP